MNAREMLLAARSVIERGGWRQYHYGTLDGPCCVMGALIAVRHGDKRSTYDDYELARETLRAQVGNPISVSHWNDRLDPATGKQEVLAALEAAAKTLEQLQGT